MKANKIEITVGIEFTRTHTAIPPYFAEEALKAAKIKLCRLLGGCSEIRHTGCYLHGDGVIAEEKAVTLVACIVEGSGLDSESIHLAIGEIVQELKDNLNQECVLVVYSQATAVLA